MANDGEGAPVPPNEADRLAALRRYSILDTAEERAFDDLVRVAAMVCGRDAAAVSLVDSDRQWFKAQLGLGIRETPREHALCAYALQSDGVFELPDTRHDRRFEANPLVHGDDGWASYAAAPLVTWDGYTIGTLCVLDHEPGELDAAQREALAALGRQAMAQIELRERLATAEHALRRLRSTEEALRAREAWWRALVENTWDGIAVVDGERIRYASDAFARLLGYDAVELEDMVAARLIVPEDLPTAEAAFAAIAGSPRAATGPIRVRLRTKAGDVVVSESIFVNRMDDPHLNGLVVNTRDVTALVAANEALVRANESLRESAAQREEFVMVAGHELRTPATALQAGLTTLSHAWDRLSDDDRRRLLQPLLRQANRLDAMVQNVLLLSQVDTGALVVRPMSLPVVDAVTDALGDLRIADGVEVDVDPALRVYADPERCVEMLARYLSNAVRYGAPPIRVGAWSEGGAVTIVVDDSGPGVSAEFRPRLFERFAQETQGTTRVSVGLGLGLAAVRSLAEAQGGTAWYEPREGGGARFAVRLPASPV